MVPRGADAVTDPTTPARGVDQRRADRVRALLAAGEYERAIGAALGVDGRRLAPGARSGFLVDVAQAQFGLGWFGDALATIARALSAGATAPGPDPGVRLMVHAIAAQRAQAVDPRLLSMVARRLRPEMAAAPVAGGCGGPAPS